MDVNLFPYLPQYASSGNEVRHLIHSSTLLFVTNTSRIDSHLFPLIDKNICIARRDNNDHFLERKEGNQLLTAMKRDGKIVSLLHPLSSDKIKELRQPKQFFCPHCRNPVIFKAGHYRIPHFAHYRYSNCRGFTEPESFYHLQGKRELFLWLRSMNQQVFLEHYFSKIKQRADLFVTGHNQAYAIEFQCASIPVSDIEKRTARYKQANITPIWILGGLPYRKKLARKQHVYTLTEMQWALTTYQSRRGLQLFSYQPCKKQFFLLSHITPMTSRKIIATCQRFPLQNISFPFTFDTLTARSSKKDFIEEWTYERKDWLFQRVYYNKNRQDPFLKILYECRLPVTLIPPLFGVPIPAADVRNHPVEWQFYIWYDCFRKLNVGGWITFQQIRKAVLHRINKQHIQYRKIVTADRSFDFLMKYLRTLVKTGYLRKSDPSTYVMNKPLSFPNTMEEAKKQEQIFYKQFRYLFFMLE